MIVFGVVSMFLFAGAPVNAEEVMAEEIAVKKPIDKPTLDWLHGQDENIPESVYTIKEVNKDESHDFVYKDTITGQETYYKIVLKDFSSDSVIWTNVTGEPDLADRSIVAVKLPSGIQYWEYALKEGVTSQSATSDLSSVAVDGVVSGAFIELNGFDKCGTVCNVDKDNSGVNIEADFVKNHASYSGGAIYNSKMNAKIGDIKGNFVGNSAYTGGAIYNENGIIGDIEGNFNANYASSSNSYAIAGAIYNSEGAIGNIEGDFNGNYAKSESSGAYGGAIYNYASKLNGTIKSNFFENYAEGDYAEGGAIYNFRSVIGNIEGDFVDNYAQSEGSDYYGQAHGGAIYNWGTIGNITGDFVANYAKGSSSADGGAIFNGYNGIIGDITGDFTENYVSSSNSYVEGGAIHNRYNGTIGDITGDFNGNYAEGYSEAKGGVIYNGQGAIGNITGDFIGNYASSSNSYAYGGAINNYGNIGNIVGDFRGNYASSSNSYAMGGAIYNSGEITNVTNSNFIDNYVSGNEESKGGAIYSGGSDLQITADGKTSLFSGNKVNDKSNAIYMGSLVKADYSNRTYTVPTANLNLTVINNGVITFDDGIDGGVFVPDDYKDYKLEGEIETYNINIDSDGTGIVKFNNLVENVTNFNVSADAKVHLGVNADIQTKNMSVLGSMSKWLRVNPLH